MFESEVSRLEPVILDSRSAVSALNVDAKGLEPSNCLGLDEDDDVDGDNVEEADEEDGLFEI